MRTFALILGFVLASAVAEADGLDCDNIVQPFVAVLCSDPDLRGLADERQAAWDQTAQRLSKDQLKQLSRKQQAWVKKYPVTCGVAPDRPPTCPFHQRLGGE